MVLEARDGVNHCEELIAEARARKSNASVGDGSARAAEHGETRHEALRTECGRT